VSHPWPSEEEKIALAEGIALEALWGIIYGGEHHTFIQWNTALTILRVGQMDIGSDGVPITRAFVEFSTVEITSDSALLEALKEVKVLL
jgi:hypothetical protein